MKQKLQNWWQKFIHFAEMMDYSPTAELQSELVRLDREMKVLKKRLSEES